MVVFVAFSRRRNKGGTAKIDGYKKKKCGMKIRRNWRTLLVLLRDDEERSKKSTEDRNPAIRVPNVTLNPPRTRLPDSLEPEWNKINKLTL